MKGVVIIRSTPIAPEPRARKTALWLSEGGWSVRVLGWDRFADSPLEERQAKYIILRVPIRAGFGWEFRLVWPLIKWQFTLLAWLYQHRDTFTVIHAADFDTIIPAFLIARVFRKRLVYDIYDFYADSHALPWRLGCIVRSIERWFIQRADAVILVDELRVAQIQGTSPKRLEVIYNTPEALPLPEVHKQLGHLCIAYVGILILGRSLLELLQVLQCHPEWIFDIAGFGRDEKLIISKSRRLSNVHFHGRVSYERMLELNAKADVMVAIYDPSIPNHRFSSANKLFDAMMLGKPLIVASGTGMDRIVGKHNLGFVVSYGDLYGIEKALATVAAWDYEASARFARQARQVYDTYYHASLMRERLLRLYQELQVLSSPDRASGRL